MCDQLTHGLLIEEYDAVNCMCCNKQIQDPGKPQRYVCCSNMKLIKDRHLLCKNCGQVHGREHMISVNFILKQLFDILGIEYKFIPLTKSKKTVNYYSQWWAQIYDLIKGDIN